MNEAVTAVTDVRTRDHRVQGYRPLDPPVVLLDELPLSEEGSRTVARNREELVRILDREDDRLVVILGPCSVHDVVAAMDYARRIAVLGAELAPDLRIVMRVYFEKPRTTVGWKGLINDPHLDGTFRIGEGLRIARRLLLDLAALGLPAGCEFLDPISPQYTSDLVSWGAIGARTTESQVHRELASGLSMPVGFKNGTDGNIQIAIDALKAAAHPHRFIRVTERGFAAIAMTSGNPDCHIILRGGAPAPNYGRASVRGVLDDLAAAGLPRRVVVDVSHGNSGRDHLRQLVVAREVAAQIAMGERGIVGVMIESFLVSGRQVLADPARLVYGQSITDPCLGWDETELVLHELSAAARERRTRKPDAGQLAMSR
jgi:3-deoxy-7-phosphoheptulonate synthase